MPSFDFLKLHLYFVCMGRAGSGTRTDFHGSWRANFGRPFSLLTMWGSGVKLSLQCDFLNDSNTENGGTDL